MDREDMQVMLARIDERVKDIQKDVKEINDSRKCAAHGVKIKFLERMVWGCTAAVATLGLRSLFEMLKR
jgi:hypothetical protein